MLAASLNLFLTIPIKLETQINQMKLVKIFFLCVLITPSVNAQNFLIKKSGETMPYKKLKWVGNTVELTIDKKQKLSLQESEVSGIFDSNIQKVLYKKPRVSLNEKSYSSSANVDTTGFKFLLKEESGKINLYKEEIVSSYRTGGMSYASSTIYYYAESGDNFKNVLITGLSSKKDDLMDFKSFFKDDSQVSNEIEKDDFVYNEKSMLRIIREYNLKNFENPYANDYKTTGTLNFYAMAEGKMREAIVLKINDSLEYKMPTGQLPLPIKLPLNVPSKVCVIWGGGSECELTQPVPYTATYYQIRSMLDKTLKLEKKTYKEFKNYIVWARGLK
jgi:hypothetical protein